MDINQDKITGCSKKVKKLKLKINEQALATKPFLTYSMSACKLFYHVNSFYSMEICED